MPRRWVYPWSCRPWRGDAACRRPCTLRASAQQHLEVFAPDPRHQAVVAANDRLGQIALGLLKLQHLLFDCITRNEPRREHPSRLSDAMRAVDGLRLDGWIPPRIEQVHVVRRRQVEAQPTSLEADEEDPALRIRLEPPNALLAVLRLPIEVLVDHFLAVELWLEQRQQ